MLTLSPAVRIYLATEPIEMDSGETPVRGHTRRRPTGRRPLPAHLPRRRVEIDLADADKPCACGHTRTRIGEDVSEKLDYEPASFVVIETVRPKYACPHCHEGVVQAPAPPQAVEKSLAGEGLLAHVVVAKYVDHLPLHRLEGIFAREGIDLPRSTLCGWVADVATALTPIGEQLRREIVAADYLQTDDTTVTVLDERGGSFKGRLWTYLDPLTKQLVFDATTTHERDGPATFLADFRGALQADAYPGYDGLYQGGRVIEVGCWAHARRRFVEAFMIDTSAALMIALIQQLYQIEHEVAELDPEARRALRQEQSVPLLAKIDAEREALAKAVLPKSPLGEAVRYLTNQWTALQRFVDDGRLAIDNNRAENQLRIVAVGRKNWLFAGSFERARRAALLYSLVQSCKLSHVPPFTYLKDILLRLATHPHRLIDQLTPKRWAQTFGRQASARPSGRGPVRAHGTPAGRACRSHRGALIGLANDSANVVGRPSRQTAAVSISELTGKRLMERNDYIILFRVFSGLSVERRSDTYRARPHSRGLREKVTWMPAFVRRTLDSARPAGGRVSASTVRRTTVRGMLGHDSYLRGVCLSLVNHSVLIVLATVCLATNRQLFAQEPTHPEPAAVVKAGKSLRPFRLQADIPQIDGRLDDAAWAQADALDDLVQWEPENGAPASDRTVLQVAYDNSHLYIAVRCYDREPLKITTGLGRRDQLPASDVISVGFDPRHDHLTGYVFETNPSGVQGDQYLYDDDRSDRDYNAVWEVSTSIDDDGWSAEYRIPFSQMRFTLNAVGEMTWGFSVTRNVYRKGEISVWTARPRGERGVVSRWGHLVFSEPPGAPRRIELLPYTLARLEQRPSTHEADIGAGVDLRVGLGSSATLSATLNPDFAQVELDPAVLNLTVFETFFAEKRPFFLEDSRTFIPPFSQYQLFHSRRIGRTPDRLPIPSSERVVERSEQTTLLGAAKLTGKDANWTYGALTAVTRREYALVETRPIGGSTTIRRSRLIEPLTSYNVARLQRDVLNGSSTIGGLITSVAREHTADAFTAGVDHNLRWDRNRAGWTGHWAFTRAPGPSGVQNGFGGVSSSFITRKHWNANVQFEHFSPTFRVNDIGFLRSRIDRTFVGGSFAVAQPDPGDILRSWNVSASGGQAWNAEQLVFSRSASTSLNVQFLNFWSANIGVTQNLGTLDDLDTRGGPPIVSPAGVFAFAQMSSDSRKNWRLSAGTNMRRNDAGTRTGVFTVGLAVQRSRRLQVSFGARREFGKDIAQWIVNRDVDADGIIDYVYGTLDRDVLDLSVQTTYAIHRDLSLQLYLQPFVAVGDYTNIRRLARPRSFDFEPTSLPFNPDFNRKSVRGNIVLRWEYVRGSTLFIVWNISTLDTRRPGMFSPFRDLSDAFTGNGTHVFMVKASYWFDR